MTTTPSEVGNFAVQRVPLTPELVAAAKEIMEAATIAEPDAKVDPKYVPSGEFIELPVAETKKLLSVYKDAKKKLAAAKEVLEDAENAILDAMQNHEVLIAEETGQYLVEHRVTTAQVFDTGRFRKEQPELAAKFQRTRYSRTFRVLV